MFVTTAHQRCAGAIMCKCGLFISDIGIPFPLLFFSVFSNFKVVQTQIRGSEHRDYRIDKYDKYNIEVMIIGVR